MATSQKESRLVESTMSVRQSLIRRRIPFIYDYPEGSYRAQQNFLRTLTRLQNAAINKGVVKLDSGQEVSINTLGGAQAFQTSIQAAEIQKDAGTGLANAGLKFQNKFWTLQ